jgi:hypothetical protein
MPSSRVTHKASLVNNTCVFGNSTGTGKQTGRNVLEMRSSFNGIGGRAYPNSDHVAMAVGNKPCAFQLKYLKTTPGLWEWNRMTGGVGRRSTMYNSDLRW